MYGLYPHFEFWLISKAALIKYGFIMWYIEGCVCKDMYQHICETELKNLCLYVTLYEQIFKLTAYILFLFQSINFKSTLLYITQAYLICNVYTTLVC